MAKKTILAVSGVIVVLAIIGAFLFLQGSAAKPTIVPGPTQSGGVPTQSGNAPIRLQDSQYAPYSYKIFPGPLSSQAQSALAGFSMQNRTFSNGTAIINLSANGQTAASFTVTANDSVYFVETSFGDDQGHYDGSLGDDFVLLVNQTGYIVGS